MAKATQGLAGPAFFRSIATWEAAALLSSLQIPTLVEVEQHSRHGPLDHGPEWLVVGLEGGPACCVQDRPFDALNQLPSVSRGLVHPRHVPLPPQDRCIQDAAWNRE